MPRCEPCQPHHGLCLGPFYLLLPCSPWKQERCGVSLLEFSMIHCHKRDISMVFVPDAVTKIVQGLGLFWSFFFFFFPVPLFSTLPVQFLLVERGWVGQLWDYTQPHINEKSYFTSRNSWGNILNFTRTWLLGPMSVYYFIQTLFRSYTKHGVMSNLLL